MTKAPTSPAGNCSRRGFLGVTGAAGASLAFAAGGEAHAAPHVGSADLATITLTVNGATRRAAVETRATLVELLRDRLGLTGTKIGCNQGQCGACTVLMDGRRVNSCLVLAVTADGAEVTTIEGLAGPDGAPHPMQAAFAEHDAFQCGYCTPGQILAAVGCIEEGRASSAHEIREYMSGNLCRCGAYPNIVAAIEAVRDGEGV